MSSYSTFTKKQAGIVYGAVKRGELALDPKGIKRMYNMVGVAWSMQSRDERRFRTQLEDAIDHFFAGRIECAQARLDGKKVEEVEVIDGYTERVADPENNIEDWFEEPGSIIREEIVHYEWVIR